MPHPGFNLLHPELSQPDNPAPAEPSASSAEPTPEQPPAEPTPASEPPKLFAGKYRSVDELERAYWENSRETARILGEYQALRREPSPGRANPEPEPDPLAPLEDYGIPPVILKNAIGAEVERRVAGIETRVAESMKQALAPVVQGMEARTALTRKYADFSKQEEKVAAFIASDPDLTTRYQRLSAADPEGAMEWAYLQHRSQNGGGSRTSAADAPGPGQVPKSVPTAPRAASPQGSDEELARAKRYYDTYKDPRPYIKARLRGMIPDSHFEER